MTREITYVQAINEALRQEMRRDPKIILLGEDLGIYGGIWGQTNGLVHEFGRERVIDTPISESAFIGAAVGLAALGFKPVVELMYVDFMGVCFEQIYDTAAKMRFITRSKIKAPIVIRTTIGGGRSEGPMHSQCLYSIFAHVPGVKCVVPSTPYDVKGLLIRALREKEDPVIVFEHRLSYTRLKGPVPEDPYIIEFGKADIKKQGEDVTIVAISRMVILALEAARILEKDGIDVEVIDPRTLVPLDLKTVVDSIEKTNRLVIVDEDYERCGFASYISALVAENALGYLKAPVRRVTAPNLPIPYAPHLEKAILPDTGKIVTAVKEVMKK